MKLLTISQVSAILNVNNETVRKYVRSGALPHVKLPQPRGAKNTHPVYRIREDTLNIMTDDGYSEYMAAQAAS